LKINLFDINPESEPATLVAADNYPNHRDLIELNMNILFVHQNFPGQYVHICNQFLRQSGNTVVSVSMSESSIPKVKGYHHYVYQPKRGNGEDIHPLILDTETKVIRAEACAELCVELKHKGFTPDIICGHPGWGELLFLPYIWPRAPILMYQEFCYNVNGFDCAFDPELQPDDKDWKNSSRIHMKNANTLLSLDHATWNITPTSFQKSSYPKRFHSRFSVIHDGISNSARPAQSTSKLSLKINEEFTLTKTDKLITFVNRHIEPYRGCHSFIRAIPKIQELQPDSQIVIVGKKKGVSYGKVCENGEWCDRFLSEIDGHYDSSRVHFVGHINYKSFLTLLQLSKVHVYLTYPFVLSWSLLEAMSSGCAIVGSATAPVMEVLDHEHNGLLVDFFDPQAIAEQVNRLLSDRKLAKKLGQQAHLDAVEHYSLERCLPRQLKLIDLVASGAIGH
jgi:glycosyltransferase involved in cell wall biosynthesis